MLNKFNISLRTNYYLINNNYNESTLRMDVSEKFNTAVGLSFVDEEHIEVVRNFVKRLGS